MNALPENKNKFSNNDSNLSSQLPFYIHSGHMQIIEPDSIDTIARKPINYYFNGSLFEIDSIFQASKENRYNRIFNVVRIFKKNIENYKYITCHSKDDSFSLEVNVKFDKNTVVDEKPIKLTLRESKRMRTQIQIPKVITIWMMKIMILTSLSKKNIT